MLLPPHQRVCVVGHLLDLHVRLKLVLPFDRGHVEIHGCGTHTQEFVQIATMLDLSIRIICGPQVDRDRGPAPGR
jgi:hypothetical protein